MLKIIKKENIIEDGVISTQVKGKLIKFNFRCKYPNVMLRIENQDNEVLWQGSLDQEKLNIYPRKTIEILDTTKLENFYLFPDNVDGNNLFIRITGLEEGQRIDLIKVLYDDMGLSNTINK